MIGEQGTSDCLPRCHGDIQHSCISILPGPGLSVISRPHMGTQCTRQWLPSEPLGKAVLVAPLSQTSVLALYLPALSSLPSVFAHREAWRSPPRPRAESRMEPATGDPRAGLMSSPKQAECKMEKSIQPQLL